MFNVIRGFFGTKEDEGVREMFTESNNGLFGDNNPLNAATVVPLDNGKFGLVTKTGTVVGEYARARDARRGAERKGFTVA